MSDRVLVAYSSKHGSTAEIAQLIGKTLDDAGLGVDVRKVAEIRSLAPYRAVVVGSAVYMGRWRREALRFLRRTELTERELWFFSSGPVGEEEGDPPQIERWTKPRRVTQLAERIGAHDHAVFGGMIAEGGGFRRTMIARGTPPELRDRRDWTEIQVWAKGIARALSS